jgi:hypothetical protein
MNAAELSPGQFFRRAMARLPITFIYWAVMAPVLHFPIALGLALLAWLGYPNWLLDVEQTAHGFHFLTSLKPSSLDGQFNASATVSTDVNGLLYTFGLPLFAGLSLATGSKPAWRPLIIGYLALLPFQFIAVYATGLKQVVFDLGPAVAAQVEFSTLQRTVVAYCYQFSTLIMPPVTAVVVWFLIHREFVEQFVGKTVFAKHLPKPVHP